jgi:hypothetical protein
MAGPSQDDPVLKDVIGLLESQQVDKAADYVRRGRSHAGLTDAALAEAWMRAIRAFSDDPVSALLRMAENDLRSEFDLRGVEPPMIAAQEALRRISAAASKHLKDLKEHDPEGYRRLEIQSDDTLAEFIASRDRKN